MKIKLIVLQLLVTVFCLGSCKGAEKPSPPAPVFEIKQQDLILNFQKEEASHEIPVSTTLSLKEWSVSSSDKSWCLVDQAPSGKAIRMYVKKSDEPDVRNATIQVHSSVKSYEIKVSQLGYGPAILLKSSVAEVDPLGGEVSIEVTSNVPVRESISSASWIKKVEDPGTRGFVTTTFEYKVETNSGYNERSAEVVFDDARKEADPKAESQTYTIHQAGQKGNPSDIKIDGDILAKVVGGQASEAQPGSEIRYSFDGEIESDKHYHSRWGNGTKLPVTLEYFFKDEGEDLDYFMYHSRNGNGNIGKFDLYVATTDHPDYKKVGSYDFKERGGATRQDFPTQQKGVTKVKFVVQSGLGGFVSCAEMQFFRINTDKPLDNQLLAVFTDLTCSELRADVKQADIDALPAYFGSLATQLQQGTYDAYEREFRIQDYSAYSDAAEWKEKLMTKYYSSLDNPMGISVKSGDELIILVGDTHGHKVSLRNVGEENTNFGGGNYKQTEAIGTTHFLQPGVNKIQATKDGQLFLVYTADPSAEKIRVHVPPLSGTVCGYWGLDKHKTNERYEELIGKSQHKYFCVKGHNILFYFHREKMKEAAPNNILSAINLWDDIVGWQHELMGLEDVRPTHFNNHIFAISPEGSYMWASDYRIAFTYTYLKNILLKENVMAKKDNAWGPAHEIGHVHQAAINWPSSTESSNNLFSNYTLYKLGKYCSRGAVLKDLAEARCVNGQGWYNMGDPTHQNESTEIHMRMNWQLWNYFHRCGFKPDFFPSLFKLLRNDRIVERDPGAAQLKFAMKACEASGLDLTEFFECWGFFVPVDNIQYSQYGTWTYNVTPQMIADAKAYMAQFPKPKHAIQYIEDRKEGDVGLDVKPGDVGYYTQFKENQKITSEISYTQSQQDIEIFNGGEAVAYEIIRDGSVIYFANYFRFRVPDKISLEGAKLYAVQADGTRIEMKRIQ